MHHVYHFFEKIAQHQHTFGLLDPSQMVIYCDLMIPGRGPKTPQLTLPETNIFAPKNGWLEYDCFLLGCFFF